MNFKNEKIYYLRNLKVSLAISLTITILLFIFIPYRKYKIKKYYFNEEPLIKIIEIPPTKIYNEITEKLVEPNLTKGIFIEEPEILSDVEVKENLQNNLLEETENTIQTNIKNYDENFPQQILEVMPPYNNKIKGTIKIELVIDNEGKVIDYKILDSTIKNEYIPEIIESVTKSTWKPYFHNNTAEYKVIKIYSFN